MALIIRGKTECSICNEVLIDSDDVIATSHFIADRMDPLWRFSDSGMHRKCFLAWNHRAEFVQKFNAIVGEIVFGNRTRHRMKPDGTIVSESVDAEP